jgi:NitT/TauT family transport system permease protein
MLYVVATVVGVMVAWGLASTTYFPDPVEVAKAFGRMLGNGLVFELYVSLSTNLQAIAISCAISLPLAYLTVLPAMRPFVRMVSKLRFLGLTGLVIPFTIVFGGGHGLKLAVLVFGMTVFLVTSVYDIIDVIPREEFDYARSLRFGPWKTVYEVVILGHLDAVIDAIRQNAAMGWVLLTMVEGLVRFEGGLGTMMLAEDKHLHLDTVLALQFVVIAIGIAQDAGISALRKLICPYADLTLDRK